MLPLGVLGLELFARFGLGLGDPPLMVAHPTIEYLFKPGTYHRFGHTIHYNSQHMRAPEGGTFPVLFLGDSVTNGGAQTDDTELITSLLSRKLGVPIGNVSAGSWGPQNLLAYTEAFGFFEAKVIVIVVSSHDAGDLPTFAPTVGVNRDFPAERPPSALWEAVTRYVPRFLPIGTSGPSGDPMGDGRPDDSALDAFGRLIDRALASGADVLVVQHLKLNETLEDPLPGHREIAAVATARGVRVIPVDLPDSGYRNVIDPNAEGYQRLSEVLEHVLRSSLVESGIERTAVPPASEAERPHG